MALLSIASRLLEKLICDQIMEYMYENEYFHSRNHGYRRGHGTTSAVLEAQMEALDAIEEGEVVGLITVDQSSAFDIVDHLILKEKLKLYGFDEQAVNWYMEYLDGREQFVELQSSRSEGSKVGPYACPQGSCSRPMTWNLYWGELCGIMESEGGANEEHETQAGRQVSGES